MTGDVLTVYTNDGCGRCKTAMGQLDRNGIEYRVINVSHDEEGAERLRRANITSVPTFGFRGKLHESIAALPEIIRAHKEAA